MSASRLTVLLCVTVSILARCVCATLRPGVSLPKETASTTLRLTAQKNDTGSWTARFGDYQMTIEHKHLDTPKESYYDYGTWTMKVKHTSTIYQDETDVTEPEELDQLASTINNLIDNSDAITDEVVVIEPVEEITTTTEEPFIAGVQVNAEPTSPSNDDRADNVEETEPSYEEIGNETPDDNENASEEQERILAAEERRKIMERYPRSKSLVHDVTEYENFNKGYEFFSEIGWLKLNTSYLQWPEARAACEEDGGHLAIPDTTHKIGVFRQVLKGNAEVLERAVLKNQAFVGVYSPDRSRKLTTQKTGVFRKTLKGNPEVLERAVLKNQVFVGVYSPDRNRELTTVLGEVFSTESDSAWFPDEPNNAPPGEDCITLHLEGKMRDVPCYYNLPFLCQID